MATKEKQALDDRGLIRHQMQLGAGLIAFGALSIPLFQMTGVLSNTARRLLDPANCAGMVLSFWLAGTADGG